MGYNDEIKELQAWVDEAHQELFYGGFSESKIREMFKLNPLKAKELYGSALVETTQVCQEKGWQLKSIHDRYGAKAADAALLDRIHKCNNEAIRLVNMLAKLCGYTG